MKLGFVGVFALLALPLPALAQLSDQKKADLEEALRVQTVICEGIADVSARGSADYKAHDLVQCLAMLDAQRADYQRFMAEYAKPHRTVAALASPHAQVAISIPAALAVAQR
jgi:hypothetical protein